MVLLPEVTLSLITEDIEGSFADALRTMRESSRYGSLIFPSGDDSTLEDVDVGDHLVLERAEVRREQVLIEDRVEAEVMKAEGLWEDDDEGKRSVVQAVVGHSTRKSSGSRPRSTPVRRP